MVRIALLAAALACAGAAHAVPPLVNQPMTKEEVKAQKVRIEEQYDQAQTRCKRVEGYARELCNEQARGERDVQAAELQMRVQPSADNDEKVRLARAEAAYSTALVKCKSFDGHARGVCRKDAKATFESAKAEAALQKEVVAQELRSQLTVQERTQAADRMMEAQFNTARERCEQLPPEGRLNCLNDAKTRFGRL
jgi:hypothetical protein